MNRTIPVLRWPGGKSRHLKRILPLISEHQCYVEPFAGGLATLLAKSRSPIEVINDLSLDVTTLYRVAQHHLDALCGEIRGLLPSRANLADWQRERGLTDIQRAARFVVRNRMSFGGGGTSFGVRRHGGSSGFSREATIELLHGLNCRLDGVLIENLDWERCVRLYDAETTFFFLDPPYLDADVKGAYEGWPASEMTRFRDVLRTLKGRWVVTVDGSDFCQKLFAEWHCERIETRSCTVNNARCTKLFSELIITPRA